MKTTIFGVLLDVTPEQDTILRRLMRKYGWMLRFAFNRLLKSLPNMGALERHLASDTELPLRYAKDAVQEAQDLIRARHQAMQDGLKLWTQRVKKTRERLTALRASSHPNARRIAGQERKLAHQAACLAFYQQHVEAGTFPPVVFGTKKRWGIGSRRSTIPSPNRNVSKRGGKHGTSAAMVGCPLGEIARKKAIPSCASAKGLTTGC